MVSNPVREAREEADLFFDTLLTENDVNDELADMLLEDKDESDAVEAELKSLQKLTRAPSSGAENVIDEDEFEAFANKLK